MSISPPRHDSTVSTRANPRGLWALPAGVVLIVLHFIRREGDAPTTEPVLVLVTDDVEATVQTLRDRGVPILAEPAGSPFQPGHTAAAFQDSESNQMMLVSR